MGVLEVKARPVDLTNCKRVPLASNAYDSSNQDLTIRTEYILGTLAPLLMVSEFGGGKLQKCK